MSASSLTRIARKPPLAEKVLIVDGLWGCGKTLFAPLIGALPRVELMQFSYMLEWICALNYLDRLEADAAAGLVSLITDHHMYNIMMSRETNFRLSDLSSVFRNAHPLRYLRRLLQPGDDAVPGRIVAQHPILLLTTHTLLPTSRPVFEALGDRLLFVEIVRHPLYTLIQQSIAIEREAFDRGMNSRSFFLMFDDEGHRLPWHAHGWEKRFLEANPVEKAIYITDHLTRQIERQGLKGDGSDGVLVIPFERFVIDPWPYMRRLEELLGTRMDRHTRRMMRRQKVPRQRYAEGIDLPIYRKYGWREPEAGTDEAMEFERRRKFAAERASPEAMRVLDQMCRDYETMHLSVGREP